MKKERKRKIEKKERERKYLKRKVKEKDIGEIDRESDKQKVKEIEIKSTNDSMNVRGSKTMNVLHFLLIKTYSANLTTTWKYLSYITTTQIKDCASAVIHRCSSLLYYSR